MALALSAHPATDLHDPNRLAHPGQFLFPVTADQRWRCAKRPHRGGVFDLSGANEPRDACPSAPWAWSFRPKPKGGGLRFEDGFQEAEDAQELPPAG